MTIHLRLPVSFFMVKSVVEQGQCIRQNSTTHTAVTQVHPFWVSSAESEANESYSNRLPWERYVIRMMGMTISLAGRPRMNAIRITPSRPKKRANGSRNAVPWASSVSPPTFTFASIQIISPAGAAMTTARLNTNSVLSNMERTMTLPICGLRKGGSSSVKAEGSPFNMVLESSQEERNVIITPSAMMAVSSSAATMPSPGRAAVPTKNMVRMAMRVGNAPPSKGKHISTYCTVRR